MQERAQISLYQGVQFYNKSAKLKRKAKPIYTTYVIEIFAPEKEMVSKIKTW